MFAGIDRPWVQKNSERIRALAQGHEPQFRVELPILTPGLNHNMSTILGVASRSSASFVSRFIPDAITRGILSLHYLEEVPPLVSINSYVSRLISSPQ